MKRFVIISFIALLALFAGCEKDYSPPVLSAPGTGDHFFISVQLFIVLSENL